MATPLWFHAHGKSTRKTMPDRYRDCHRYFSVTKRRARSWRIRTWVTRSGLSSPTRRLKFKEDTEALLELTGAVEQRLDKRIDGIVDHKST